MAGDTRQHSRAACQSLPFGSATIQTRGLDAALSQGWAELTNAKRIGGVAVFRQRIEGRPDVEAAVPIVPSVRRFVLPFDDTRGFVTAIALASTIRLWPRGQVQDRRKWTAAPSRFGAVH